MDQPEKSEKLNAMDPVMASLLVNSRAGNCAIWDDRLNQSEPAGATVLPVEDKSGEELDFDETDVIALLKKRN